MGWELANESPEQRSWLAKHWLKFTLIGTIAVGFWVVMQNQGPRDYLCPNINKIPAHNLVCGPEYDRVSLDEAEDFLFRFYNAAHRTNPSTSWAWISGGMRESGYGNSEDDYAQALNEVLWGEVTRVSAVPDGLNIFDVAVRRYRMDDRVAHYAFEVRLRRTADNEIIMVRETSLGREGPGERDYHPLVHFEPVELHRFPRSNSQITLDPADQGEDIVQLRAFCEIEVPSSSTVAEPWDAGWWTRTNQGWIRNADTTLEGDPQEIIECGRFALEH